jgi:DNA-binding GntR family transcriptional regulator
MKSPLPHVNQGRVLADWVTESLREAILAGHFDPGERVDQDLVAQEYDVSRTPVREAIRILESEGFIEVRPHRGAFIATVSPREIREIYEIRGLLEAEIVRQVTPVITAETLHELARVLDEGIRQYDAGEHARHYDADVAFHRTLTALVENPLFVVLLEGLNNRVQRVRRFAQLRPGYHLLQSFDEHRQILEAMQVRDAERAAQAMRDHCQHSATRIAQMAGED